MELVVGITGASGTIYAIRLLETLRIIENVKVNLVISEWAKKNIEIETEYSLEYVLSLADRVFDNKNMAASISSGSFLVVALIILPCSMTTLSAFSSGYTDSFITSVADVTMKEGRKLIISPRETPLNSIHLENMLKLSKFGVRIVPPMPAFYNNPKSIDDIINHTVMKILDQVGIHTNNKERWQ